MAKPIYYLSLLLLATLTVVADAQTQFPTLSKHQLTGGLGYQHNAVSTPEAHNGIFGFSGNIVKATFGYAYRENLIFSASAGFTSADTQNAPPMESALYSDAAIVYTYALENIGIGLFAKGYIHGLIKGETENYPNLENTSIRVGVGVVYQNLLTLRPFVGVFYENRSAHQSTNNQVVANVSDTYLLTEAGVGVEFGKQFGLAGSVEVPFNTNEVVIRINSLYKF